MGRKVKRVIKKSGKKQIFSSKKLRKSIDNAAKEAKVEKKRRERIEEEITEVVEELIELNGELTTSEIRDIVLMRLEKMESAVARAWLVFEMIERQKKAAKGKV